MTTVARARATTTAAAEKVFATWAEVETWPEWNTDLEWVRRDGPLVQGATGQLKPKGGPKVSYTVEKLDDDRFLDVSKLPGARLRFDHRLRRDDGSTTIEVEISMTGPMGWLWRRIMGGGLAKAAQQDLDNLITAVEKRP